MISAIQLKFNWWSILIRISKSLCIFFTDFLTVTFIKVVWERLLALFCLISGSDSSFEVFSRFYFDLFLFYVELVW